MGFLSAYSGTKRIDLGDEYWIEIKECLTAAEKQRAEAALASPTVDMSGQGSAVIDMVSFHNLMMCASIVGWNLDDDEGVVWALSPEPVKLANIARLPAPVFDVVWQQVDELNGPRSRADQVRFPVAGVGGDPDGDGGAAEPGLVRP